MEVVASLIGVLIVLSIPVAVVVLIVWVRRLGRRVQALETALFSMRGGLEEPHGHPAEAPGRAAPVPAAAPPTPPEPSAPPAPSEPGETAVPPVARTRPAAASPPRAVVLRAEKAGALARWLQANWIYLVAAVSLALAGVFLVQYGIEKGYLTPVARVLGALGFGALLVAAGEFIRRRWGDGADAATAYLPSVFSGAGIVSMFAAILAALHFYALISPALALAGLVAVAALAIVLGWFTGPLLAAVGIAGAAVAPFLVGGESDAPEMFYAYFALIALVGLAIDAVRRWAWVSALTLVVVYGAAFMLYAGIGRPEGMMALMAGLVLMAMLVPPLRLFPDHDGAAVIEAFASGRPRGWPGFPTRLVAGSLPFSVTAIVLLSLEDAGTFWLALLALALLFAALALWARRAGALEDLALLPVLGVLALPVLQMLDQAAVYSGFRAFREAEPGTPMPWEAWYYTGAATALSLMAAWRSLAGARWPVAWAAGAALIAPLAMVALEAFWQPAEVIGAYPWALTAAALAIVMAALAGGFARADAADKRRVALFTLATLGMISFALILVLSETALTLALALTVLVAAALDRRYDMRPLAWFVQAGVIVVGWRLVIDPGLGWAEHAAYPDLALGYGGAIAILWATLVLLRSRARLRAGIVTESAAWTLAAVFANVLVFRLIGDLGGGAQVESHWSMGLAATIWLSAAANQVWRLQIGGPLRWVRLGLAALYGVAGLFFLSLGLTLFNPLSGLGGAVLGPPVVNTLIPGFLLPALPLGFVAWRYGFLKRGWRIAATVLAAALGALWLALAIRHFWRGAAGMDAPGVTQPELYTYTIAMLAVGAGLLYQSIAKGSAALRRVGMSVIAVTVVKVFLVDVSGLEGLMRVFSFLALGLALAGLAFLNRWAASRIEGAGPARKAPDDPGT